MPSRHSPIFRLEGQHQGQRLSFDLSVGEFAVGSATDCDVILSFAGVSRDHALIRVSAEGLVIEDLGSKNGTFVGGRRMMRAAVADGDRLGFGPVELALESLDRRASLAIRFENDTGDGSPLSAFEHSPLLLEDVKGSSGDPADLQWLDDLTSELRTHPLDELLARLDGNLRADGSALVEWDATGQPLALASAGRLGVMPKLELIRELPMHRAADGDWFSGHFDSGTVSARLGDKDSRQHRGEALVVWQHEGPVSASYLRLSTRLLLLAQRLTTQPQEPVRQQVAKVELHFPPGYVVGRSESMQRFYEQMAAVSRLRGPVLLRGETGVGKELLARTMHDSVDPGAPYEIVNCAAISPDLLEAEMFGVTKGAATGVEARKGYFSRADGGSLFLDEIGEMAPSLQAKLLRTLQNGEIQPVGGSPKKVNVRVIAATNVDLESSDLRRDLYFRLAVGLLEVPPLRETRDDVPRLVRHFLHLAAAEMDVQLRGVTTRALEQLRAYPWPGNVRELAFVMRRITASRPRGGIVDLESLPASICRPHTDLSTPKGLELKPQVEALERRLVRQAMIEAGGRQVEAAKLLGASRSGLAKKLDRLGLRDSWAKTASREAP